MMQKTCEASANWDDNLLDHLVNTYLGWRSKLISLKEMNLKRLVLFDGFADKVDVHLFCHASEKAYAAGIYIVASTTDSNTQSLCIAVGGGGDSVDAGSVCLFGGITEQVNIYLVCKSIKEDQSFQVHFFQRNQL